MAHVRIRGSPGWATARGDPPNLDHSAWFLEPKLHGLRALAFVDHGSVQISGQIALAVFLGRG